MKTPAAYRKKWNDKGVCINCGSKPQVGGKTLCSGCATLTSTRSRIATVKVREDILNHYGRTCACCGETETEFLQLDHVDGGGNRHRKATGRTGTGLYYLLRKQGYPKGNQTLCANCNFAKGKRNGDGQCPHKRRTFLAGLSEGLI